MDRKLGHKLIDILYNSGNLSLKECGDNRDKLNKLKENQIEIFLTSLPNAEHFLPEIKRSSKDKFCEKHIWATIIQNWRCRDFLPHSFP